MGFPADFLQCGTLFSSDENQLLVGWGERRWREEPDGGAPFSFYSPSFFLEESAPWFTHREVKLIPIDLFTQELKAIFPGGGEEPSAELSWREPGKKLYESLFNDLKENYLGKGLLLKGVPFAATSAKGVISRQGLARSLLSLLDACKRSPSYLYGFWDSESGILGATPELLFDKKGAGREVETAALAGTSPSGESAEKFFSDPKEGSEHSLVIEGIKEALSPFGTVVLHERELLHLPFLKHLYTPITFTPRESLSFIDLVRALHPTPALGTYPKAAGEGWLRSLDKALKRGRFGAPIGFTAEGEGKGLCYVAIRNMQWEEGLITIYAGGGVVKESTLEKEWKEIELKLQSIKKMLALGTAS